MANSSSAQESLDMATASGKLVQALVVGKSDTDKVELFLAEADKEAMLVLLARAQAAIIRSMDQ